MTRPAVAALGVSQLVNWGVLYYAFAMLVQPLEREFGVPTWVVTGAFSLALLMSALLAPTVGWWGDRDRGALLMQGGGVLAAALLVAWTFTSGILAFYVVWAGLGFCMAATLYEPVFVIVGRAYTDPTRRLRALAAVTLLGGLASTIFLPVTGILVQAFGWRRAVVALAAVIGMSTLLTYICVFRHMPTAAREPVGGRSAPHARGAATDSGRFAFVVASFALTTFTNAGFAANLVPALGERGVSTASAAMLGGLIGVMQLPGRALLMHGAFASSPAHLVAASLLLHAVGLAAVAFAPSMLGVVLGTMAFAVGAGLTTLVRPYLIQTMYGSASGGYLNGRLARYQQLARAAGPLILASVGNVAGYGAAFGVLALAFTVVALASRGVLGGVRPVAVGDGGV